MGSAMNRLTASADAASADWAKRLDALVERAQPEQWNATAEKALSGASAVGAELQRQSTVWCAEVERLHEATQRVVDFSEQQLAEQRGQRERTAQRQPQSQALRERPCQRPPQAVTLWLS